MKNHFFLSITVSRWRVPPWWNTQNYFKFNTNLPRKSVGEWNKKSPLTFHKTALVQTQVPFGRKYELKIVVLKTKLFLNGDSDKSSSKSKSVAIHHFGLHCRQSECLVTWYRSSNIPHISHSSSGKRNPNVIANY